MILALNLLYKKIKYSFIYFLLLNSFQFHRQQMYTNHNIFSGGQNTIEDHIFDPLVCCWSILCMFYIDLFSRVVHKCQIHLNRHKQNLSKERTCISCILVLFSFNKRKQGVKTLFFIIISYILALFDRSNWLCVMSSSFKKKILCLINFVIKKFKYNAMINIFLPQNLDFPHVKRLHDEDV